MDYTAKELGFKKKERGLYSPTFEHDACGAGFICHMKGKKSHDIIHKALEILVRLTHRGAVGADPRDGDGAGLLIQIPDAFFRKNSLSFGISDLPPAGDYAVGMTFLPKDEKSQANCMDTFNKNIKANGLKVLGWRDVPINVDVLGKTASEMEPTIKQVFVGKTDKIRNNRDFVAQLFISRRQTELGIAKSNWNEKDYFYFCSLSNTTMIFKGLLVPEDMERYYRDLKDEDLTTALALVHQRFSTNTFPRWDLAQPFRYLCHNGEINTVRGNINAMNAREALFKCELFGDKLKSITPIIVDGRSDSAMMDNALELLVQTGRSLPHAMMMLIPEAWERHQTMDNKKTAFYQYHSCLMEPWDGPASVPFTDGKCIGAVLDRNGLRPSRYSVTKDDYVIMGSETGVVDVDPADVVYKGRLEPGKMFLVDMEEGRIISDEEIKMQITQEKDYNSWLRNQAIYLRNLPKVTQELPKEKESLANLQRLFGYTYEDEKILLQPMAQLGKEAIGSMGTDTPVAVLSSRPRLLFDYFKQLFAQVTNPPLDGIREELVTALITKLGGVKNIFKSTEEHCHQIFCDSPVLRNSELNKIRHNHLEGFKTVTVSTAFDINSGIEGLKYTLEKIKKDVLTEIKKGASIVILSDRGLQKGQISIPILLVTAGVHHFLTREKERANCSLIIESGEIREVHHFATVLGYGASAINPYLAYKTLDKMIINEKLVNITHDQAVENYRTAVEKGLIKVMSKMGISTLHSYMGAQIFEAIGLKKSFVDEFFTKTTTRIEGIGLEEIYQEVKQRYENAYPSKEISGALDLPFGGEYQWRRNGEAHLFNPLSVAKLQDAARRNNTNSYEEYANLINDQSKQLMTLRGLLKFSENRTEVPLDEVEPWTEIVKRFKTGAMSYGSISAEAHENLAIAMNRIGGRSNSGEGGEKVERFTPDENGDWRNSAIKQVASGRFGVTSHYLSSASEIQIKMAQGAKPGEGGQLPGEKVYPWIAATRHSTPYVGLISPPPHHDIYSIEDLSELIFDLKNANPSARINVKLVAEAGVGTVAAGVAKAKADVVLVSGFDGGTGASPLTSLKHTGLPWELGIAETHQTLVMNDLRGRIVVECDGQLKTGRDVAIACLLGAEEFGFATAPLVASGCIMMRACHLNTCPVGIATQDPQLRKKFTGKPEHVINYMHFVAEELRVIMAKLGFRKVEDMVGKVDCLETKDAINHYKAKGLDFSKILYKPDVPALRQTRCVYQQNHGIDKVLDNELIAMSEQALKEKTPVTLDLPIKNINRATGAYLSYKISKMYGEQGLPLGTINLNFEGSAGQSFGAFGAKGIIFNLYGDANDYMGKGLSGATIIVNPSKSGNLVPKENIIAGNVLLYGATQGKVFIHGVVGERFCVRNSGAIAVVEGVGDHGCEYMTGGRAVILGKTGRNFAAGMSGGVAYVYDEDGNFATENCNLEMVELEPVEVIEDIDELRQFIEEYYNHTKSVLAREILDDFKNSLGKFIKVMPVEYKKALRRLAEESKKEKLIEQQKLEAQEA